MKSNLAERRPEMTAGACPICGHPFSLTDSLLLERDENYQCRSCWYRIPVAGKRPSRNGGAHNGASSAAKHAGTGRSRRTGGR